MSATPSGSTAGGGIGGSQTPWWTEIEASAATMINRQALGIVHDSIEVVFTQTNPRYNAGYLGGFGYKSTAEQPMLSHPLETMRILTSFNPLANDAWKSKYDELFSQLTSKLSPDLLNLILAQKDLPLAQQNPAFVALNNLLIVGAKVLTILDAMAKPIELGGLDEMQSLQNFLMPFAALKGALTYTQEMGQTAFSYLEKLGPNYRDFDGVSNLLNQLSGVTALLQQVNTSLAHTPGGELTPAAKALADKAFQQLEKLSVQIDKTLTGDDLQILRPMLKALSMVAGALSLPFTGSAPLYVGLHLASLGFNRSDSAAGLLGPHSAATFKTLMEGILPDGSMAGKHLLQMLATTGLICCIALAALTADGGVGLPHPDMSPADQREVNQFVFGTALQLVINSHVIEAFFHESIAIAGGDERTQTFGGIVLGMAAYHFMIHAAATGGTEAPANFIGENAHHFEAGVFAAQHLSTANGADEGSHAGTATSIANRQAQIALDEKNYEAFISAYSGLAEKLDISPENFLKEVRDLSRSSAHIVSQASQTDPDQPLTGIINVV